MAGDFNIGAGITLDGEAEFKKAVSSINKELTVLGSEMKKVTAQFSDNADSIEALTSKQDVLNKKAEEQRRKIEMLTAALEQAKQEYGENSDKVRDWQIKLNNAEADLAKTESQVRQTANQIDNFGKETDKAGNEMDNASNKALRFGDILKANLLSQAIVDGVRALGNSIAGLASGALESADSIQALSDKTGIAAEKIQELSYIGDALGVSTETITGSFSKLINNMSGATAGSGTAYTAFQRLGVRVTDANGNLRDSQAVWQEVISSLGKVSSETERTAIAQDIFGKSAAELNPIIGSSKDELAALSKQAYDTGAIMSSDTVANLDNFGDAMEQLKSSAQGAAGSLLGQLTPSLQPIIENLKKVDTKPLADGLKFILDNASTIAAGLAAIAAGFATMNVVSMITGLVKSLSNFKEALLVAKEAQVGLNLAMKANVIGIVVTAVAALVTGLVVLWNTNEGFRNSIIGAWNAIKAKTGEVITAIKGFFSGLVSWFQTLPDKMLSIGKNVVEGLWNGIQEKIAWLKGKVSGFVDGIKGIFTGTRGFDTHSPSKWAAAIGGFVVQGLGIGMINSADYAQRSAAKVVDIVKQEIERLNKQLEKAETDTAKAGLQDKIKALEEFQRDYESALSELERKQQSLSEKLSGYGELFSMTKSEDGKNLFELGDLQSDIDKITAYGDALGKLKEKGASESLLAEITSMSVDDAILYTGELLGKTKEEYDKYMKLWDEKQKLSAEVAKKFYSDEFAKLKTEFVDKVPVELDSLKSKMQEIGKKSASSLADGFWSQKSSIVSTFKSVLSAAMEEANASLSISSAARQINSSKPTSSGVGQLIEGAVNGMAAIAGAGSSGNQTITVNSVLDGRVIASAIVNPLKAVVKQSGVKFP